MLMLRTEHNALWVRMAMDSGGWRWLQYLSSPLLDASNGFLCLLTLILGHLLLRTVSEDGFVGVKSHHV